MISNYIGIITALNKKEALKTLTKERGISTIPIAGKYRAIDFPLSNMVNSKITRIGILSNKNSKSLRNHVETGKSWGLTKKNGGLYIFNDECLSDTQLLCENMEILFKGNEEFVVISPTHMIGNIDLKKAMEYHENSNNDITLIYKTIDYKNENFIGCDSLEFNNQNQLTQTFGNFFPKENIKISTEVFILKRNLLASILESRPNNDIALKDLLYRTKHKLIIGGFEHLGYLSCINSLENYFRINMELRDIDTLKEIFGNENRPIFSKIKDAIPTHYSKDCCVNDSIISNECSIRGTVINSVLSRYVKIEPGAIVENSIIFPNCIIKNGVVLKNVIIDKEVVLGDDIVLEGHPSYPLVIQKRSRF